MALSETRAAMSVKETMARASRESLSRRYKTSSLVICQKISAWRLNHLFCDFEKWCALLRREISAVDDNRFALSELLAAK